MTRLWKQCFVLMLDFRGTSLPVAFGWLANKEYISYYCFMFLVLQAFHSNKEAINAITGRTSLKLRRIRCDFEWSIHKALFHWKIKGCYFHFR